MKRFIISFTIGIITVFTMLCGAMNANAMGFYECEIVIKYKNAPEGTVFADILFKKVEDDEYALTGEASDHRVRYVCIDSGNIELDEHCGLAEYDDGFTSFMMNRCLPITNMVYSDSCSLDWGEPTSVYNSDLFEYYGEFKVAYCDKEGNVLLVTDPVRVKPRGYTLYEVYADGAKAEYNGIRDLSEYFAFAMIAFIIGLPALLIAITAAIVFIIIGKKNAPKGQEKKASGFFPVLVVMGITAAVVTAGMAVIVRFAFF
ncbi:MAG: hypothetical protein J6U16_05470 [Ruminococcus sp.]|nr:hypothetical protein [Ruminococcus sp.]